MDTTEKTLGNADLPLFAIDAFGLVGGGLPDNNSGSGGGGRGGASGADLHRLRPAVGIMEPGEHAGAHLN